MTVLDVTNNDSKKQKSPMASQMSWTLPAAEEVTTIWKGSIFLDYILSTLSQRLTLSTAPNYDQCRHIIIIKCTINYIFDIADCNVKLSLSPLSLFIIAFHTIVPLLDNDFPTIPPFTSGRKHHQNKAHTHRQKFSLTY